MDSVLNDALPDSGGSERAPSWAIKPVPTRERQFARELRQLAFNWRLFALAEEAECPLLEALKFLCTVSANLDAFFEGTIAKLKLAADRSALSAERPRPEGPFDSAVRTAHELITAQYRLLNAHLLPALQERGVAFLRRSDFTRQQTEWVRNYFFRSIRPVLTPIGLDPAHPFPRVISKSLNFAVEVQGKDAFGRNSTIAIVQAPPVLPRVIRVPADIARSEYEFVFLSSLLHAQIDELFPGMDVGGCYQFRVTRNTNRLRYAASVGESSDASEGSREGLGKAVRLEVVDTCSSRITKFLLDQFDLEERDLYGVDGPVNLVRLMGVYDCVDRPELKFSQSQPNTVHVTTCARSDTVR